MSLFKSLSDMLDVPDVEDDSVVKDDNTSTSAENSVPVLSSAVLTMRTVYDGIHDQFKKAIDAKCDSLDAIDKAINKWIDELDGIVSRYKKILAKLDDIGDGITDTLTLDTMQMAWEIIQDTPILRRYLGEANYWYLYDTLGLLATETSTLSAESVAYIKQAIKEAILATISATDGIISLQTYIGYLQSAWGFLYVKFMDFYTLDSVLPQVTTAYWYKPTHTSLSNGTRHQFTLTNNPPGQGFTPLPIPIPTPIMTVRHPEYIKEFDYQNPDTWYYEGEPYYMPNTMTLLHRAYAYWGSSYTDALNLPNIFYKRRSYNPHGKDEGKPLRIGRTLHQLDTSFKSVGGTVGLEPVNVDVILSKVFTPHLLEAMSQWHEAYISAYGEFLNFVYSYYMDAKSGDISGVPDTLTAFWIEYPTAIEVLKENDDFMKHISHMLEAWVSMKDAYANDRGMLSESVSYTRIYDDVMTALVKAGQVSTGYSMSLESNETLMVGTSFNPVSIDNDSDNQNWTLGVPYVAYKVNTEKGELNSIVSRNKYTTKDDSVIVEYPVGDIAFVMFPSNETSPDMFVGRGVGFSGVLDSVKSVVKDVTPGLKVGDSIADGMLMEYLLPLGMEGVQSHKLGKIPESLCLHRSSGAGNIKELDSGDAIYLGNMFIPDGRIPESFDVAEPPKTFYSVYEEYKGIGLTANEELAEIVGYSIFKGREPKFPCFGIYGNLLGMASWNYKEMPYSKFVAQYEMIDSDRKLCYKKSDPSKVILYHSSYLSTARNIKVAIYHEAIAQETKSFGPNDTFTYYVFPGVSISVTRLPESGIYGYNLGNLLSVDATGPDGAEYHYMIVRNPTPHSAKYVNPKQWSIMDGLYELLLLASSLAELCGDNGKRYARLLEDFKALGITIPTFLGELPENNGQYVPFTIDVFEVYSKRIEAALDSVYEWRAKLIAATEAW